MYNSIIYTYIKYIYTQYFLSPSLYVYNITCRITCISSDASHFSPTEAVRIAMAGGSVDDAVTLQRLARGVARWVGVKTWDFPNQNDENPTIFMMIQPPNIGTSTQIGILDEQTWHFSDFNIAHIDSTNKDGYLNNQNYPKWKVDIAY